MTDQATFTAGGKTLEFALHEATEGNGGYDISSLLKETGNATLDVGYTNTASCKSEITYIDGDAGILRYRGYPIDQLAESSTFVEVSYLLIYGELPTQEQLTEFNDRIKRHTLLKEDLKDLLAAFPRDAHPMSVLSAAVSALGTFYPNSLNIRDQQQVELSTIRLLAKVPTIAAYAYKKQQSYPTLYPEQSRGLVEDFVRMTFGWPTENYVANPTLVKALDRLFILHADHEQNCSTSTVRLVGSAEADLFASISAGIHALSGPLHGGANSAVLRMLDNIEQNFDGNVDKFVEKVKNKEDGVKLMGFGHRVYKNYDPRAAIVKKSADEVFEALGVKEKKLELALKLEEIALNDDYFISRKLYPNVDFYTGLIYKAMGFPTEMFTVLFAIGRMPGWIAQWREMMTDPTTKIGRPRQVYIGETERKFVEMSDR